LQSRDARRVVIGGDDVMSGLGETTPRNQSHVPAPNHR
jgi:hypothetical protein